MEDSSGHINAMLIRELEIDSESKKLILIIIPTFLMLLSYEGYASAIKTSEEE